ncbi:MAG: RluA family pseudouridine synthase [Acidimicrobiales bacterium]
MRANIPPALAGERVDRVVATLTGLPRSAVAELVVNGAVSLGDRVVMTRSHRVLEDEVLEVDLGSAPGPISPHPDPTVSFEVLHVDDDVVVVDKPAGLVVHPGAGNPTGTLVNGLLHRYPEVAGVGDGARPGIVHRLDKGTSGLMVVARSQAGYESLVAQLAERSMSRVYLCLVWGRVADDVGTVDAPIGRSTRQPTRMAVSSRGRPARTHYRVLERFADPSSFSVLDCSLETGRTHQIRVHMAAIGHPVVGDSRYAPTRPVLGLTRPFLHARQLAFSHPRSGESLEFTSDPPRELGDFLADLS